MILKPFLYLDLDGTVRYSKGKHEFIQGPEDIAIFPDVVPVLKEYRKRGFFICGVSNQGGVAFGYKTEPEAWAECTKTSAFTELPRFAARSPWDYFAMCFAHEKGTVEKYAYRSLCRKPDIGMLVQIEKHFEKSEIRPDYAKSLLVGDRDEDRLCAERAGIAFRWADDFFERNK